MKNISILGSTGSIGCNTLNIVRKFPELFNVKALTAGNNIKLFAEQINEFEPDVVAILDEAKAKQLYHMISSKKKPDIKFGEKSYVEVAQLYSVDMVISAIVGAAGLKPTLAAIKSGKDIALANKETLVMAGDIVMKTASEKKISILPVDSEHSAIFQCLSGQRKKDFKRIILTASGGPFRNKKIDEFSTITSKEALSHPTWQMGKKISIDSATLMNKGFEVIEAKFLFGISHKKIEVIIHPQSIVHSMVVYKDGSVIAQMGVPDMKGAISYALSYPERLQLEQPVPDFAAIGALTFESPDFERFPCLGLAYKACEEGHTFPAVLNAANEICVQAFLDEKISFVAIPELIEKTMEQHSMIHNPNFDDILSADKWARDMAKKLIS